MGRRRPKPKGAEHHIMRGNCGPSRHGPRRQPPEPGAFNAWDYLRLPTAAAPRPLDPIEE
jgi:hypothetical protein